MKKPIKIRIPKQLEMLCEILETTPQEVLQEFADNLSLDYKHTSGSDERMMAMQYFIRVGYGMHLFTLDETENFFNELERIRCAYSAYGSKLEWFYVENRKKQYNELLKQWRAIKEEKKKGLC